MQRAEIIARGDVQRVGFRDAVQKIAWNLGLSGTVQNLEPYDVKIVAEGEEAALLEFVKAIKIQDGPIRVQALETNWSAATGEFQYFKILRGDWQEERDEKSNIRPPHPSLHQRRCSNCQYNKEFMNHKDK